jgi:transcriptional regulator
VVARRTRRHEAAQAAPWKMTDAPSDYLDSMLKAIVGIEIEITRLVGKFKLGQNKEVRDMLGAAQGLKGQGEERIADAMTAAAEQRNLQNP